MLTAIIPKNSNLRQQDVINSGLGFFFVLVCGLFIVGFFGGVGFSLFVLRTVRLLKLTFLCRLVLDH